MTEPQASPESAIRKIAFSSLTFSVSAMVLIYRYVLKIGNEYWPKN